MMRRMTAPLVALAAACGGDEPVIVTNGPHMPSPTSITVGAGQPLYPSGEQALAIRGARRVQAPGCPAGADALPQILTLANP